MERTGGGEEEVKGNVERIGRGRKRRWDKGEVEGTGRRTNKRR